MKILRLAGLLLAAAPFLTGCANFWDAPSSGTPGFSLSNSGNITLNPSSTGNATITVTPTTSFTGTVSLTCAITSSPTGATSPATCGVSPASVTIGSAAQTATLTATSGTTTGAYNITVTGVYGNVAQTTVVCAVVGTGTCSGTASTSGNFYVLNASSLTGYSISNSTLTTLSGSSFTLSGASAMAVDPTGSYLWVATLNGIAPYKINTDGSLTAGSVIFNDNTASSLRVDPSGKWLLDASLIGILYAYPITTTGTQDMGRLIQTNAVLANTTAQPGGMAISPNGTLITVALGVTGTEAFPFNSANAIPISAPYTIGTGNVIAPYGSGGGAVAVAIDPTNRFLYIGETAGFPNSSTGNSGDLRVFIISSGSLSEISYSASTPTVPYASGGTAPHAILPAASGNYVYVANWAGTAGGIVTEFQVVAATPALTLQSNTVSTGGEPFGLVEDGTNSFVLAVSNLGTPTFNAYTFDATTTGKLDALLNGSVGTGPIAIVAVP